MTDVEIKIKKKQTKQLLEDLKNEYWQRLTSVNGNRLPTCLINIIRTQCDDDDDFKFTAISLSNILNKNVFCPAHGNNIFVSIKIDTNLEIYCTKCNDALILKI